jgi:AAA family ATP:ADP antiporter
MAKDTNLLESLKLFMDVEKGERLITLMLFLWQFLFICSYYVLRPVRRGLFLDGLGNDWMPLVYIGTALVTGVVVWAYSKFKHHPRKILISSVYGFFTINLVLWWQIFQNPSPVAAGAFWVWLDVFSIMGVVLFWMYANDVFNSDRAKRLFGILAAGGGLGAVLGSTITASLVKTIGSTNLLLVAAGLVGATLAIFLGLEKISQGLSAERKASSSLKAVDTSSLSKVIKTIFSNKFLLMLTCLVTFERVAPDLVQFLYNDVLKHMASGSDAIAALDANLERWRAIAEFVVEMFFVSFILQKFGTKFALTSNASVIFAGLITYAIIPNPAVLIVVFHADEGCRHAWFKAAKELLYTVTPREVLYSVKPVIEMFFYRFARGIAGVVIYIVNTLLGFGSAGVLAAGIVVAAAWFFCAMKLSGEYHRMEAELSKSPKHKKPDVKPGGNTGTPNESEKRELTAAAT